MSEQLFKQTPETPTIIIERDDEGTSTSTAAPRRTWRFWLATAIVAAAAMLAMAVALYMWRYYYHIGVPVSVTPAENIEKLQAPLTRQAPEVVATSDSILGVALNLYRLKGLQATIELAEPDEGDSTIFLYSRCADYTPEGKILGSLVADGQVLQTDRSRLGYMAMAEGRMVIGISRSDKVKDYVAEHGGSFFRQFILVSDGVLPPKFYLHGKVERRAIGRMGNSIYYIATRHKETLWDFADALREYGFVDAIYITGGNAHSYYRDGNLTAHDLGESTINDSIGSQDTTAQLVTPWLVFRPCN